MCPFDSPDINYGLSHLGHAAKAFISGLWSSLEIEAAAGSDGLNSNRASWMRRSNSGITDSVFVQRKSLRTFAVRNGLHDSCIVIAVVHFIQ